MRNNRWKSVSKAFTLAELLIALAILGVIATFTIPKVLQAQQDSRWNAAAKETAGMISQAYSLYKLKGGNPAQMKQKDLTPYMNYIKTFTNGEQVNAEGPSVVDCDGTRTCLYFANGSSLIVWGPLDTFGGTADNNAFVFIYDADGQAGGATGIVFWLYYDGRVRTRTTIVPNTTDSSGVIWNPGGTEPSWFHWN